jgi:hypothetical protein
MSSSNKDVDASSLASDTTLLNKGEPSTVVISESNKRSFLSRLGLSGSRQGPRDSDKSPAATSPAASASQQAGDGGKQQSASGAVDDIYRKFPNLGTNTRLT